MEKSITVKLSSEHLAKVRELQRIAMEDYDEYHNVSEIIRLAIEVCHKVKREQRAEAAKELPF